VRRALAALATLALAACGGAGDGAAPTTAAPAPPTVRPDLPGPTGAPPPPPTAGEGGATPTTPAPAAPTVPPAGGEPWPALDAAVSAGAFAPSLLRPDRSSRLVVEVHAGASPAASTVDHVRRLLADASGKPVDVVDVAGPGGDGGDREWTSASIRDAADAGAVTAQGGGTAVVRLLFLRGSYEGEDGVLGVAVRGDVAAVFVDRVADAAGLFGNYPAVEESVAAHELGHLLGLVDLVLDTGRADPEHPGHSSNRGSVMYWAVESDLVGQLLGARPPRDFDDADRADLAAIRGG